MEFSSNAFLARILDKESAETLGSDSFEIVGFTTSSIGSVIGLGVSITASVGVMSLISGEGILVFSGTVFSAFSCVSVFLTTSTIE